MSVQLYSHSKSDLEKAVEIILKKATEFTLPSKKVEESPEDLVSQIEASKFLQISVPTIIDWRKNKNLPHYNFNGRYYYSIKELLEYGKGKRK
ncbi:helix-turn-helix domain-containing protein [Riemerella anatipestifer]|uniref:Helix-turn-helix domain-containing protein n=1 Tax=Riemerella anatipestifer TaxID=34085 RepID=A0AAP3AMV2_RIEAN|nr:helix-turn-helix domain-containing protein [Riemerella anatipestifer]AZZ58957.1 DNA-binding protein [Riemerella anatipestifer]MBT0550852.1 helix-turn-helix domain-containing protein [Riemerella anatipestifer]MBT0552998.1 helix-turn-helix domain-containing protein [Riemerella anatipestifer]MBT0573225.1 helix-turn-helix domain-containing protein [Riemerella anatipestifer]MCE3023693.1 helix-turn-helix domain-containing protein [Riemerella anatipestifer]